MTTSEIIVPASTSNLGASFDTCGLALALYLRVEVEPRANGFKIVPNGEGSEKMPVDESNLIIRCARYVAAERGRGKKALTGAWLRVDNQIPLSRGLGSSSAAIIAGISVYEVLTGDFLREDEIFRYALHFEGHGDNLAPSLLGGMVVAVLTERRSLVAVKRPWPEAIKVALCIPEIEMETVKMREVLPQTVTRRDAIYNIQRGALLQAALASERFELINEALRDRLHQPYRVPFAPGLKEVLELNDETEEYPGLLGVAISGAGSTLIALTVGKCDEIAEVMVKRLASNGIRSYATKVNVDNTGRRIN
jgi:homoserine kinase